MPSTRVKSLLIAFVFVLAASPVWAQTPTFPANQPLRALWDQPNTTGVSQFAVLIDGLVVAVHPLSILVNGTGEHRIAGLPAGNHTFVVRASGPGGAATSAEYQFVTVDPPTPPTNLRILTVEIALNERGEFTGIRLVKAE